MKNKLLFVLSAVALFLIPSFNFGQAPNLGTTVDFVLFSTDGAVGNTGVSHLTGKVGTNDGSSTGFGNVNGGMQDNDAVSAQAASDLLIAYNQLNTATPNFFPTPLLGNGQVLTAGVYAISGAAIINLDLILDAENNANAVFIFQIAGPLSTNANSAVKLINGAQACNVFWKVEGLVDMATGTTMRGSVIANNEGITMNSGAILEGRALTTDGAISVDGVLAYTPIGCGSPTLTGPVAPWFGSSGCFGIFSSNSPVTNSGVSNIVGDVGTNGSLTTGYNPLTVTGTVRPIPDEATEQAESSLLVAYNYLISLSEEIELLYPAQFGNSLVLTPHTYVLNGGTKFSDTLYLNAQGNANAVFVIKVYGDFETSAYSHVILINGAQAENVFWMLTGAVDINNYSIFNGTIISQGAINLFTGVTINGRALTIAGAIATNEIDGAANILHANCATVGVQTIDESNETVTVYPNPFRNYTTIQIEDASPINTSELTIYNDLGVVVISKIITNQSTTIDTGNLPSGIYFFKVTGRDQTIQSGRMISQQ